MLIVTPLGELLGCHVVRLPFPAGEHASNKSFSVSATWMYYVERTCLSCKEKKLPWLTAAAVVAAVMAAAAFRRETNHDPSQI